MKRKLMDYIREESQCNYYDLMDYFKDLNDCGHELKAKYLEDLLCYIANEELGEVRDSSYHKQVQAIEDNAFYNSETTVELNRESFEWLVKRAKENETTLFHKELGSLKQISDSLYREMNNEIDRNKYSDLTLNLEGAFCGIKDILELNNVVEKQIKQ